MSNAIKWTPGPPPELRERNDYLIHRVSHGAEWVEILGSQSAIKIPKTIKAHALINYPLTVNEAVTYDEPTNSWVCWDINGTGFHTGLASREEAEAAYRDEYGDW